MLRGFSYLLGALVIKPVFLQEDFIKQLKLAITNIHNDFNIDSDYLEAIEQNSNDIIVCIISLLHDAKITLDDNNIGRLLIAIALDKEIKDNNHNELNIGLHVQIEIEKGRGVLIQYTILNSKAKIIDYIDDFNPKNNSIVNFITTVRNDKKLFLVAH